MLAPKAPSAGQGRRSLSALCAVAADELALALAGEPAAVVYQEAGRARELVTLLRKHTHGELLARHAGKVCAGKFEGLGQLGLVNVDRAGLRLGAPGLEFFDRVLVQFLDVS